MPYHKLPITRLRAEGLDLHQLVSSDCRSVVFPGPAEVRVFAPNGNGLAELGSGRLYTRQLTGAVSGRVVDPRVPEGLCGREAGTRVGHQKLPEEVSPRLRERAVLREAPGALHDGGKQLLVLRGHEGRAPCQHHVPQHPDRPQVAGFAIRRPVLVIATPEDLRGDVVRGAAALRHVVLVAALLREPEVGDLDLGQELGLVLEPGHVLRHGVHEQHVVGLQVAVGDALLVHVVQGGHEVRHQLGRHGLGVVLELRDHVEQVAPADQLQNDVQRRRGGHHLVEADDALVAQFAHDGDLRVEVLELRRGGLALVHDLHGKRLAALLVDALVHDREGPAPELLPELVDAIEGTGGCFWDGCHDSAQAHGHKAAQMHKPWKSIRGTEKK
mmetsp:Transcript_38432/g.63884  ORF Transcript_38432/g.63884 Transcript_38432/m.63884 type:complete len:385 (+) Transcript_38432:2811-3965(+)